MRAFEKKELERKEAQSARRKQHKAFVLCLLGAIAMTVALFFLTSCRARVETVYVDKVKTEYRDVVRIDSVYNRDTVAMYMAGDTVFKEVIKWRERWQLRVDSFTRVDSVPYAVATSADCWLLGGTRSYRDMGSVAAKRVKIRGVVGHPSTGGYADLRFT